MEAASNLHLSPDELLIIWGALAQRLTDTTEPICDRIKEYLEEQHEHRTPRNIVSHNTLSNQRR